MMLTELQDQDAIFSRAIEIASAEEREAFLVRVCGHDAALRRQMEERVAAHFQAGNAHKPASAKHANGHDGSATRVGPYKILKQIGEGGAGIVYLAEQQEPARRMVALKVIKEDIDWRQVIARFESERHALARMDHPHIAKVLDGGTKQSGQPYFVMELIEGIPLTKYCDEKKLSPRQRLELFVSVCQAVQHAHQKGILHGDLKPSNVLVAGRDGKPAVKVLDFGVAQATRQKLTERTLFGKPEYLSPEQARLNDADLDTRGDVYSLGVLLYELLTGTTPLTRERLKEVALPETLRLIREEETPPPSTRLKESKAVRGELDCLVMKALQKDRARRYETVNGLTRDLQRYLADEPVEACPPDAKYRLWKWARKCPRILTVASALLLLALVAAIVGSSLTMWASRAGERARKAAEESTNERAQARKIVEESEGQRDRAEEARKTTAKERDGALDAAQAAQRSKDEMKAVLAFLKDKMLAANRPEGVLGGQGKNVTLRQAVNGADSEVASMFAERPLVEASVREVLGSTYLDLGDAAPAVKQYERAMALREALQGINHADTAACRNELAVAYRRADRTEEAGRLYDDNNHSPTHAAALAVRGALLLSQKKPAEAELKLRESLTLRQTTRPDDWTTFDTKSLLGEALLDQKKYADAEPLLLSGYEGLKQRAATIPSWDKSHGTRAIERLVRLYEAWGQKDKAAQWQKTLEAAVKAAKKS